MIEDLKTLVKNKDLLSDLFNDLTKEVENGNDSALEVHILGKALSKIGADISKSTLNQAIDEAEQYAKQERSIYGISFEIRNSPDTYDFEQDSEYFELKEEQSNRLKILKEAIKAQKMNNQLFNEGVLVTAPPLKKAGGLTLSVSFK